MPAPGFVRLADMPDARSSGTSTVTTSNGLLYVLGGIKQLTAAVFNTFWSYDLVANSWTALAPIPIPIFGAGMCSIGSKIYAVGGANTVFLNTLYEYDIANNVWTKKSSIPTTAPFHEVVQPVACAIGTTIHLITWDLDSSILHYWKWEQTTDTWNHLAVSTTGLGPAMGINVLLGDIYITTANNASPGKVVRLESGSQFHRLTDIPTIPGGSFLSAITGGVSQAFGLPARDLYLYPNGDFVSTNVRHYFWEYNILTNTFTTIDGRNPNIGIATSPDQSTQGSFSGGFVGNVIFNMGGLTSSTTDSATFFGMDLGGTTPVEPVPTDTLDSWYVGQGGIWHRGTPQIGPTNLHGRTYVGKNGVWTPANRID